MTSKTFTRIAMALCLSVAAPSVMAQEDNHQSDSEALKQYYLFKQKQTPDELKVYDCAIFLVEGNQVVSSQGIVLGTLGKDIVDLAFSPAGISYAVVSKEDKNNVAAVFSPTNDEGPIYKFKNKKLLGNPTAIAYTPDARNLIVAAGKNAMVFDARTFLPLDTLQLPFEPTRMSMSNNSYFLLLDNGKDICVYNYEGKKPRQSYSYDEGVADVKFNRDDSELAILTSDGVISIYDTRNFMLKNTIDDIDGGLALDYNFDGKYVAVLTGPERIEVINLLNTNDREIHEVETGNATDVIFLPDSYGRTLMAYTSTKSLNAERMNKLAPYYGKLITDEANARMAEWLKMQPGETIEAYNARVNDESRRRQMRLYEGEISTQFATDLLSMSQISLGKYDRANQLLDVDFSNMPSILLPVPEADLGGFSNADGLEFRNAKYGVMADDKFELIYAEVYNQNNGKTYTYDNIDRVPLSFVESDENVVSIEVIQKQQMEEMRLQEIKRQVTEAAKEQNIISDHTQISVSSVVEPDYDAEGNRILNYKVNFTYEVDPKFTIQEDFAPGKYHVEESGAASSMLKIVKQSLESDLEQYLKKGKKLLVKISGTADATPIVSQIKYDGSYGEFVNEPVYKNGQLTGITITPKELVKENEQLAFLRAMGVKNYLHDNVEKINDMNTNYQYSISVSNDKGSQFRRITAEFIFVDAF